MADDVDDLLRRAMATLDRETPAGYFDELPQRTLARLDAAPADDPGDDPADELARERTARTGGSPGQAARTAPPGSSSQRTAAGMATGAPDARSTGRRWRVAFALAGTGLAAAVVVLLFSTTSDRASPLEVNAASAPTRTVADSPATAGKPDLPSGRPTSSAPQIPARDRDGQFGASAPGPAADEFRAGMQAVVAEARRCLPPGPRGAAILEVTVLASGEVQEVRTPPPYAGTAAEACVARAVKSHTFPSRTGSAQTFRFRLPLAAPARSGDPNAPTMK